MERDEELDAERWPQFRAAFIRLCDLAAEIVSRGTSIGTIRVAEGAISGFNGVVYIQVADIKAACEKAKALGGTIVPGFPFDLSDGGARIRLSGLLAVPRAFELRLDTGVTYPASVCYRQPDAAGVRFLEAS